MAVTTLTTSRTTISAHFDDDPRADTLTSELNTAFTKLNTFTTGNKVLTYGTTIAPDLNDGNIFNITATDTVAYAISNPLNATTVTGVVVFIIKNSSGGTMGNVTFGDKFKLGAAFDKPADTKTRVYTFVWNGTYYIEMSRTAADIT